MKVEIEPRKFSLLIYEIGGTKRVVDSDITRWGDMRDYVYNMLEDNSNDVLSVDIRDDRGSWETWKLVIRGDEIYPTCSDTNGG